MKKSEVTKKTKSTEASFKPTQFELLFQQKCIENGSENRLVGNVITVEPKPGTPWTLPEKNRKKPDNPLPIYIVFRNYERDGLLEKLYMKHVELTREILLAMFATFEKYNTITTLKLQYCCLKHEDLEVLQAIMMEYKSIVDVNLDGNPNLLQNYYQLLQNTSIRYFSLKRCKINEYGIKLLCSELCFGVNNLDTLNLTGNFIDDIGATCLACMLRENRKITTLVLADNWITDIGLKHLMSTFQTFSLTFSEILIRRNLLFEYHIQKRILIKQFKEAQSLGERIISAKSLTKFGKKMNKSKSNSVSFAGNKSKTDTLTEDELIEQYVAELLGKSIHPFVIDCELYDEEIKCSGNFNVTYLNLAYNKITVLGCRNIIDALEYQLLDLKKIGLLSVALDGNFEECLELDEVNRLLYEQSIKFFPRKTSKFYVTVTTSTILPNV